LFTSSELSNEAKIAIDIEDLAAYLNSLTRSMLNKQNPVIYSFDFIVSGDRDLSLKNPDDAISFSKSERSIYQYIIKNVSKENIQPATIELKHAGKTVNANSVINLQFDERASFSSVKIDVEKNRKTKQWEIRNKFNIDKCFNEISPDDADYFYTEFEDLLYSDPTFTSIKKGRYILQFEISDPQIIYKVNREMLGEKELNYSFGFTQPKRVRKKKLSIIAGIVGGIATVILLNEYGSQTTN
jgi:hypothetical protein